MNFYNSNPFQQQPQYGAPQMPRLDPQQFAQLAPTLNQASIEKLIAMAQQRGISNADIQQGLNIINSFR